MAQLVARKYVFTHTRMYPPVVNSDPCLEVAVTDFGRKLELFWSPLSMKVFGDDASQLNPEVLLNKATRRRRSREVES